MRDFLLGFIPRAESSRVSRVISENQDDERAKNVIHRKTEREKEKERRMREEETVREIERTRKTDKLKIIRCEIYVLGLCVAC